jgi:serine/threonine-protein kinase
MAPEQLAGAGTDPRTDIWALGCLLFESATGERPFRSDTSEGLVAAILRDEPRPLSQGLPSLPEHLDHLIRRCLEKDPEQRWQSARDLGFELGSISGTGTEPQGSGAIAAGSVATREGPSIVVLPFANMSSDPEQEYFCDGMADEIIGALTRLEDLRVVARTSAFSFKGRDLDVREIGRQLRVRNVLEGSVRKAGNRLRISTQLIDVDSGYRAVQDEIASRIVDTLEVELSGGRKAAVVAKTDNQAAYDLYLRAEHHRWRQTEEGFSTAVEYLERALEIDPEFAAAYASIANILGLMQGYGYLEPEESLARAEESARRALTLAPDLAKAHSAVGFISATKDWDWTTAGRELRRALELNPGDTEARLHYNGSYLIPLDRTGEALEGVQQAHSADPLLPVMNSSLAEGYFFDRQLEAAIRHYRQTVSMFPEFIFARIGLAIACTSHGLHEEALQVRAEIFRRTGRPAEAEELEAAYARGGERGMLQWLLARLEPRAERSETVRRSGNLAWGMAVLQAALGDVDECFRWLEEAVRRKDGWLPRIQAHPWLDPIRSDPRYGRILQQVGLA